MNKFCVFAKRADMSEGFNLVFVNYILSFFRVPPRALISPSLPSNNNKCSRLLNVNHLNHSSHTNLDNLCYKSVQEKLGSFGLLVYPYI